jgi:MFS family permease
MSQTTLPNGTNGSPPPIAVELRPQPAPANDTVAEAASRVGWLRLPRVYWMLWTGMLLNRLGGTVFFFLSIYLTRERGLRPELAGLIVSLYAAGGMVSGPVGGALSDRVGRRATLLLGTSVAGALMLALGFARSTIAIAAIAPFLGFFSDLCRPALQAAVADVVRSNDRTRAYGLLYWAINLGFAGASAFGGVLAERHFALLFVIDAISTFAYGAVVFLGVPETRPASAPDAGRGPFLAPFVTPFRDRPFVSFVLIHVLLLLAFSQVIVALPLDMSAHGLSVSEVGWVMGLNGLYIVLAQPLALRWLRGLSHVRWLVAGAVLTGLGLGATAFAGGALVYALSGLLWTMGEIGFSTGAPALVAEMAPREQRGAYQGTFALAWGIASVAGPALGSLVLARSGPKALWVGCLGVCLVAAALYGRVTGRHVAARGAGG